MTCSRAASTPSRERSRCLTDCARALARRGCGTCAFPRGPWTLPASVSAAGRPRSGSRGCPPLDLGACLFRPEEAGELAARDGAIQRAITAWRRRTREGLVIRDGRGGTARAPAGAAMQRLFGRSLRLRSVAAGSCGGCEAELVALGNVVFDLARFGVQFVASPRHADGLVVTGAVSRNMRDALLRPTRPCRAAHRHRGRRLRDRAAGRFAGAPRCSTVCRPRSRSISRFRDVRRIR